MFNLDDCIAFLTSRSAKIFSEALEKRLKYNNVTRTQWIAMYYIDMNSTLTQRELADKMSIKEPTVVRMLQKMEQEGYLCRNGSEDDKRIKKLKLSETGKELCAKLTPVVEEFKKDTIAGISEEDLQTLKDTLEKMVGNLS